MNAVAQVRNEAKEEIVKMKDKILEVTYFYSRIPILRTSKGNENWVEKSESSRNRG